MKINEKTTLKEILEIPGGEKVLVENHVPCPNCPFAAAEMGKLNIGQIAKTYGLDLQKIIKELKEL